MFHYSKNAFCTMGMHQLPQQPSLALFLFQYPPPVSSSPPPFKISSLQVLVAQADFINETQVVLTQKGFAKKNTFAIFC